MGRADAQAQARHVVRYTGRIRPSTRSGFRVRDGIGMHTDACGTYVAEAAGLRVGAGPLVGW
jgi:hypothetical protein